MNHGTTTTGYKTLGCRCEPCTRASVKASKLWRVRTGADRGDRPTRPDLIDVTPVRAHVDRLVASGWTKREIAAEIGVTEFTLWSALYETRRPDGTKKIRRTRADAILALDPLEPVDVDQVVVDRLVAGADWRTIGATRAERIQAALRVDSLVEAERRFGLRAGRDFPNLTQRRAAS